MSVLLIDFDFYLTNNVNVDPIFCSSLLHKRGLKSCKVKKDVFR